MNQVTEEKITIDGYVYDMKNLSEIAKDQIANIQFVDARLQELQNELAVSDTTRIGYTNALGRGLEDNGRQGRNYGKG